MKVNKKILNKLLISFILSIVIFITAKNVYGYEITHKVVPIDSIYTGGAPYNPEDMIYRNQVKAHVSTQAAYENGTYNVAADGWVYMSNPGGNVVTGNEKWDYSGTPFDKFVTIYQMFHKYQNSIYSYESSDKAPHKKYYDSTTNKELSPSGEPKVVSMNAKLFYDVISETASYSGLYWKPANDADVSGLIMEDPATKPFSTHPFSIAKSAIDASRGYYTAGRDQIEGQPTVVLHDADKSTFRFAVVGDTYISDQIITKDFVNVLWEKFGDISDSKELTIYGSSVNRTNEANSNGEHYWAHMDTAYKFFKTTLYGKKASNWINSKSILGGNGGNIIESENSIVNLYDNTFIFPKGDTEKIVYVRHIDKTNGKNELISNLINTRAIEVLNKKDALGRYQYVGLREANLRNVTNGIYTYNEYYEFDVANNNYIMGNIKYSNDESYTFPVKSLNYTDINLLTANEKKILSEYNCTGAVVGYGDSYEAAVSERDVNVTTGAIINGNDWTSVEINGNSANKYIIIDFYYEEKPPVDISKTIYVRHIDDTDGKNELITGLLNTRAIEVLSIKNNNKYQFVDYRATSTRNLELGIYKYNEVYQMNTANNWIIGNIKYNNSESYTEPVKSLNYTDINLLTANEKKILSDYNCVGAVVGYGDTYDAAVNSRDINRSNNVKIDGGDWTYEEVIGTGSSKVIIIDFYYKRIPINPPRHVYVRHIDVTDLDVNTINVNNAITKGNVLKGTGQAEIISSGAMVSNQASSTNEYQEYFSIMPGEELKVSKSNNDDYNCIGSNIVGYSENSFTQLKNRMNTNRLNIGEYSEENLHKQYRLTTDIDTSPTAILIDFYYKAKHDDTVIARNPVGRLSFYTLEDNPMLISGDSSGIENSASGNINTTVTDNSKKVYDVIPSGESLKMSVDNAYVYMLGAINIQEQEITNTYTFDYTITQPFKVKYTNYYGKCSTHGKIEESVLNKNTFSGTCGTYLYTTTCSEGEEGCTPTAVYCENELTVATEDAYANGNVDVTYTYTIPYDYTYYKVKNMRTYNISKIELLDNYRNSGLPLFDGNEHTVTPKSAYDESFANATFSISSNDESAKANKTLIKTLTYAYSKEQVGDTDVMHPYNEGVENVKILFKNKIDHSKAAKMEFMDESGAITPAASDSENYLKAELYLKNDEVYFTDQVANKTIYIVGDDVNKSTTKENSNYEYTNYKSEKYAKKIIDLSKYTSGKTKKDAEATSNYTYDVTESDRVSVSTVYPNTIAKKYLPSDNLTTEAYFNDDTFEIPKDRLNGKRYSYGKIYYNLLSNNNVLNFDASYDDSKNGNHNWNDSTGRTAVAKSGSTTFVDTEMKKVNNPDIADNTTTIIKPTSLNEIIWEYGKKDKESTDVDIVDVFTPVSLKTWVDKTSENADKLVNHTGEATSTFQIQKNARFAIKMQPTAQNGEYTSLNTNKYLMQYYIKFDFDVQNIKIIDAMSNGVQRNYGSYYVSADTWIGPIYNQYGNNILNGAAEISAVALSDQNEATSVVNQEQNEYTVRAVAYNSTTSLLTALVNKKLEESPSIFVNNIFNQFSGVGSENNDHNEYYGQQNITGHSGYIAEDFKETVNLSRVYDFKVTDLKDLDWKDIFRKSTTATTNVHTSKAYYSGIKKWNVYTTNVNELLTRDASEIGATKQQILPIGPYKNTNTTYTKAPKLGYKFSFDLKTTGATADKEVIIEPEFYYISKEENGNTGKPTIKKEIDLYYKNSSNKYVPIKNYNLYFVPDDGYRLTFEGTDEIYRFSSTHLSKSTVSLGNAKKLTLKRSMMEEADNMFVQIWYGEYKLPNSTIAVPRNGDINRDRLTEGYIGVKFKITVDENDGTKIYYNSQDKTSSKINTTQWDYEGYLGYNKDGDEVTSSDNIRLALEGMSWKLTQEDYEFIRGTVILYDTDARASSDYN